MLHKDYDGKGSVAKTKSLVVKLKGLWRQDELIRGKLSRESQTNGGKPEVGIGGHVS
jgi:hypothetical protein